MPLSSLLVFAAVIAVATATPGPTVVTVIARVLAGRRTGHLAFATGLVLGDVLWLACAVFGIAAIAMQAHELMVALRLLGAGYLLYLAWRLWTAPAAAAEAQPASVRAGRLGSVAGGLALAISNPKTMMFYLALLPNLLEVRAVGLLAFLELALVLSTVYAGVLASYTLAAGRARRLLGSAVAVRRVNRSTALVMSGTAAFVATRS